MVIAVLNVTLYIILAFAPNLLWILLGQTISGICFGGTLTSTPIFLAEISEDYNRGKFGCFVSLFIIMGQLYTYLLGLFFHYRYLTFFCTLPALLQTMLLFFLPETPVYLIYKGKKREAIKSLKKYRGTLHSYEIDKEIQMLEHSKEQTKEIKFGCKSIFKYRPTRWALIISLGLMIIQTGTGIISIMSFLGPIFEDAQTGLSGNMTAFLICSIKFSTLFFVSVIIERTGRKPLLITSVLVCGFSLLILGLYFFLKDYNIGDFKKYSWIALFSMFCYILGFAIGSGPIPLTVCGELFPVNFRSTALSMVCFVAKIYNSIILILFPLVKHYVGFYGCVWFFALNCFLGGLFIYLTMPETRGKSLEEIQEILKVKARHYGSDSNGNE